MTRAPRVVLPILLLALAGGRAEAAPWSINYQGSLSQDGVPVTGTRTVYFRVYTADSGLAWTSPQEEVQIATGVFRTSLSFPDISLWLPRPLSLETVVVSTDGAELAMPPQTLHASAFALAASSAQVVTGRIRAMGPGPHFVRSSTLGVGALASLDPGFTPHFSEDSPLYLEGALTLRGMAQPALPSAWGSLLYFDSGMNKFKVSQGGGPWRDILPAADGTTFVPGGNTFGAPGVLGTTTPNELALITGGAERMRLKNTMSHVLVSPGIYAASADKLLTVGGSPFVVMQDGKVGVGLNDGLVQKLTIFQSDLRVATSGRGLWFSDGSFMSSAAAPPVTSLSRTDEAKVGSDTDGDGNGRIIIKTSGIERMTLTPAGKVGIANANPPQIFVVGNGTLTVTASGNVGIGTSFPEGLLVVSTPGASSPLVINAGSIAGARKLYNSPADAGRFSITGLDSGSNEIEVLAINDLADTAEVTVRTASIGVGYPAQSTRLIVAGTTNDYLLYVSTQASGVSPNLTVDAAGSVGVNTASPQSALQVGGDYLQIPTISGAEPAAGDCMGGVHDGRLVVRKDGGAGARLRLCVGGSWVGF